MDNKYSVYRSIRYNRTYRTLGKMSWWRVALGVVLIVFVLFMSGFVSQLFARTGQFRTAEKLMIVPEWMEKYKPETKAFIEAGVLFEDGNYEAAWNAFSVIEDLDAADTMENLSLLRMASEAKEAGNKQLANEYISLIDSEMLSEADREVYESFKD